MDNDIITRNPVDRSGNSVLVANLQRVQNTQDLGGVSTGRSRVGQDQSDLLRRVNDKHGTDSELNTLVVDVSSVLVVDHVVSVGNFTLWVGDDRERQFGAGDFVNVLDPRLVGFSAIGGETNEFCVSLFELWL